MRFSILFIFIYCSYLASKEEEPYLIRSIVVGEDIAYLQTTDFSKEGGIFLENVFVPKSRKFVKILQEFIGRPITTLVLNEMKQTISDFYKSYHFPFVRVLYLPGEVSNGVIKVAILMGKVGNIYSEGARIFPNEKIASNFGMKKGDRIDYQKLSKRLNWINRNPFYQTNIILEPGERLGETDITLKTKDRIPIRIFGGYENTGNQTAGQTRFLAGLNWGSVSGCQINTLFLTAPERKKWWAQTGSFILPLIWEHILETYGYYTQSRPDIGKNFQMKGKSWEIAGKYKIPFLIGTVENEISIGYEFKRTNNFLLFSNVLLFDNYFDISQFVLGYQLETSYEIGATSYRAFVFYSPGDMTAFNKSQIFQEERPGAKSRYLYVKMLLEQVFHLPYRFQLMFQGAFQKSTQKLLPSEEFSLGGFFTIRGYKENQSIADNGFYLRNELHFPALSFSAKKTSSHLLQFLGFVDVGFSYDVDQTLISKNTTFLSSIGPGMRYNFETYIRFRVDYGFQLKQLLRIRETSTSDGRVHISAVVSF